MKKIKKYRGTNAEALLRRIQEENLEGATLLGSRSVLEDENDPDSQELIELIVHYDEQQARLGSLRKKWRSDDTLAADLEQVLRSHEVRPEIRRELLGQLTPAETELRGESLSTQSATLTRILTGSIPVTQLRPQGGLQRKAVVVLFGPPSCGKTTLASQLAFHHPESVALLSTGITSNRNSLNLLDFARQQNLAHRKVEDTKGLKKAVQQFEAYDTIVVDTPAICQESRGWLVSLGEEAGSPVRWEFRYHVVLSLQTQFKNNLGVADTYLDHPVSSFAFTRLDQVGVYRDLVEIPYLKRIPLSTLQMSSDPTGEPVPATPETLAQLLLHRKSERTS